MTEKRFGIIKTKTYGLYVPLDKMKVYNFSGFESELDCIRVVNALNDLEEKRRENGKIASKFLEENEQLKAVVKGVIEILSEEVDLFSDKATEHDINAYIELKELDNKDAYYMATATKKAIKLLRGIVDD